MFSMLINLLLLLLLLLRRTIMMLNVSHGPQTSSITFSLTPKNPAQTKNCTPHLDAAALLYHPFHHTTPAPPPPPPLYDTRPGIENNRTFWGHTHTHTHTHVHTHTRVLTHYIHTVLNCAEKQLREGSKTRERNKRAEMTPEPGP